MNIRFTSVYTSVAVFLMSAGCSPDVSLGHNDGKVPEKGAAGSRSEGPDGSPSASPGEPTNGSPDASPSDGTGGSAGTSPSDGTGGSQGSAAECTDVPPGAAELVSGAVAVQPGEESYACVKKTLTEDMSIVGLAVTLSPGVRDVTLAVGAPDGPDGTAPCNAPVPGLDWAFISDAPSSGVTLAAGSALHFAAGQQIVLVMHGLNLLTTPLAGNTSISVVTASASEDVTPAALPLVLVSRCSPARQLIVAPWPLMPGGERFICARATLASAVNYPYLQLSSSAPTENFELSVGAPQGPDGVTDCSRSAPSQSTLLPASKYTAGTDFVLPNGHIDAGQQLLLKLDVINKASMPATGMTVVEVP
jgi:hypothetical protein